MVIAKTIKMEKINDISRVAREIIKFDGDIDFVRGRQNIDGKSIIALFAFDPSTPFNVILNTDNEDDIEKFHELFNQFVV